MSNEKGFYGLGKAGFGVLTGVIAVITTVLVVLFKLGVFGGQDKSHFESRVARIEAAVEKQGQQINKALTGVEVLKSSFELMREYSARTRKVKPAGLLVKHIEPKPRPEPEPETVETVRK